jgi:hypothetical protein
MIIKLALSSVFWKKSINSKTQEKGFQNVKQFFIPKSANYNPPYNTEYLKEHYPNLLKDPVHAWRAKTGIELIHKEPTIKEQKRIWKNWEQMTPEQQTLSDKQSIKFFGKTNRDNQTSFTRN